MSRCVGNGVCRRVETHALRHAVNGKQKGLTTPPPKVPKWRICPCLTPHEAAEDTQVACTRVSNCADRDRHLGMRGESEDRSG